MDAPVEAHETVNRVRDGALGGVGTLTGMVVGGVALGLPGYLIGASLPCRVPDDQHGCWHFQTGMLIGGGVGAGLGGIGAAGASAWLAGRDARPALLASGGLVVTGGLLALGGLAVAPGADSAAVPGLAVMMLGLPIAGGIGVALGDRREARAVEVVMVPWSWRYGGSGLALAGAF